MRTYIAWPKKTALLALYVIFFEKEREREGEREREREKERERGRERERERERIIYNFKHKCPHGLVANVL